MTKTPALPTPERALQIVLDAAMRHLVELPDPRDRDAVLWAVVVVRRTYE